MQRRSLVTILVLTLTLPVLSSCSHPRYYSKPSDNIYLLADYYDAIKLWTAHDEIHYHLIGVADLNAVYKSWEVRQAYINAVRNRYASTDAYMDRITQRELNGFNNGHEFLLGLYCYKEEWNKLTGPDPVWHLILSSDTGGPVRPRMIEKMDVPPDQAWMYLDDLTHGRTVYRVIFPLEDEEGRPLICESTTCFKLCCDSLLGNLTLRWSLEPVPEKLR